MSIQVESRSGASAAAINWVCHSALFSPQSETDRGLVTGASFLNGNNFLKKCRLALMPHNGANNETSTSPESSVAERPRRSGFWNRLSWVLAPVMWLLLHFVPPSFQCLALATSHQPPATSGAFIVNTCNLVVAHSCECTIFSTWLDTMFLA